MGYFDQRTGTWNEGMPPGMESLNLATEYARPLNVTYNEVGSTPYSSYPDGNVGAPREAIPLSEVNAYRVSRGMNPINQAQYDTPGGVMGGYANDSPQTPTQPLSNLVKPQQVFVPPTSDAERQQQAYDYRKSRPATDNYVRNNTTGAVQDLPPYQPQQQARPAGQVSGAQATGDMVNNLISLGQRQNIPRDQLSAMVQYQASAQPGSPSAEDLYRQSFQYGTPVKDLIAAHSAIGSGSAAREKEQLGLMKTRAELVNLQSKALNPEGIRLKQGERFKRDGSGEVEAIPGSDLANKQKAKLSDASSQVDTHNKGVDALIKNINVLIGDDSEGSQQHPGLRGSVGYIDANIMPFTQDQATAKSFIKSLKDKSAVSGLQSIRQAGTAPGSITEKEWPIFQNLINNLDAAQDIDSYKSQLKELRDEAIASKGRAAHNYQQGTGREYQAPPKSGGASGDFGQDQLQSQSATNAPVKLTSTEVQESLFNAKKAIQKNPSSKAAIIEKLKANGIDPRGL